MTASASADMILWKSTHLFFLILSAILLLTIPNVSTAFVTPMICSARVYESMKSPVFRTMTARMSKDDEEEDEDEDILEPVFATDFRGRPSGVVMEDLGWRIEKLRLEEANKRRFLKSGPRFLPYVEAKKWVQAWGLRWTSKDEWNEWIASGEKRNSYIPSRPNEYYTRTGDWISWDDWLGVESTKDNSTSYE